MITTSSLIVLPFAVVSALLIHELGHLVVGVTLGVKPALIRISVFEMCFVDRNSESRPGFALAKLLTGEVIFFPEGSGIRWKWASLSLAGPVVSLAVCLSQWRLVATGLHSASGLEAPSSIAVFRFQFAVLSGLLFFTSIYPDDDAFSPNDCFHFLAAIKSGDSWARWEGCLTLLFQNWRGIRPRLWPTSALDHLQEPNDRSRTELRAYLLAIYVLGDRSDGLTLSGILQRAASLAEAFDMYELFAEFAFWEIVAYSSDELGEASLRKAEQCAKNPTHPAILKARGMLRKKRKAGRDLIALRAVGAEIAGGRGGIGLAERAWLMSP